MSKEKKPKAAKRKTPASTPAAAASAELPLVAVPSVLQLPPQMPLNLPLSLPLAPALPLPLPLPPRNQIASSAAKNVPAFLNKLYNMVSDPSSDLIHWSEDGQAFIVQKHEEFAQKVLPRFFKHNNFSSFVRQLNMYGFHKVPHLQQGALINDGDLGECWEFANPHFQRNQPDLLCLVTRKKSVNLMSGSGNGGNASSSSSDVRSGGREGLRGSSSGGGSSSSNAAKDHDSGDNDETYTERNTTATATSDKGIVDVNALVNEISAIKRHQVTISTDLKTIQRENQALWNDTIVMREQYRRQQETIDKIVRFLATVFEARNKTPTVAGTSSGPSGPPKVGAPPVPAPSVVSTSSSSAAGGNAVIEGFGGLGSLDFLGLGGGLGGVSATPATVDNTSTPLNKKRKLLLGGSSSASGNEYGGGTASGIVVDDGEFLNFDVFNNNTHAAGVNAGGNNEIGSINYPKRMASLPSSYANGFELLDDKIFELIQSPPVVDSPPGNAPIISSASSSQHNSPNMQGKSISAPKLHGNPTQQKIQDVQQKAVKIQEEIDLLDDHLLSASALLGIDELEGLNMDDLFGTTSAGGGSTSANPTGVGVGHGGFAGAPTGVVDTTNHGQLQELEDDDWFG